MIDNAALLLFGFLIVYTVFRAIKLDRLIPWFSTDSRQEEPAVTSEPGAKK